MYEKPILLEIVQVKGEPIIGARVQIEAPNIPGFLAIESQDVKGATQYIALSNIASFTAINEEVCNVIGCIPTPKVKVKEDNCI